MPGFIGLYNKEKFKDEFSLDIKSSDLVVETMKSNKINIQRRTLKKFLNDKVFLEDNNYIVVIEGAILNLNELIKKYEERSFFQTILKMYEKLGETFFNDFRGSFSGIFYDKKRDTTLCFTNHTGDKFLYYADCSQGIIFGSTIAYVKELLDINKVDYALNQAGVYSLLSHGFMIEDLTLIDKIKRITAGKYLRIENGKGEVKRYHMFDTSKFVNDKEDEIIEKVDGLFRKALIRQVNKNKEYGYKTFAGLSAGMETRIINYALKEITDEEVTNFTYSEPGFYDDILSKSISRELKNNLLFMSLEGGNSLFNLEDIIKINEGMAFYYPGSQIYDLFKNLNTNISGGVITGLYDGLIKGKRTEKKLGNCSFFINNKFFYDYLRKLEEKYKDKEINNYPSGLLYWNYERELNGGNVGSAITLQLFGENFSPFYDVDLLNYLYQVPRDLFYNNNLYDKWMMEKYPAAAKYLHNGIRKIGKKEKEFIICNKKITISKIKSKIKSKISGNSSMAPLDKWYKENVDLKKYMDNYFESEILKFKESIELKKDLEKAYLSGEGNYRDIVLVILAFYKKYLGDNCAN